MTEQRPPNILFIMMDQLRHDALGCTGGWVRTPNIDRIAASGVRFVNCVTTSPICIPARFGLATGQYPHNMGIWQNRTYTLSPDASTWMQVIRDAGYRTSVFGKTHLHPHALPPDFLDLREKEHLLHAYGLDDVDELTGPQAAVSTLSNLTARWEAKGLWDAFKADVRERVASKPHLVRPTVLPLEDYYDVYVGEQSSRYLREYRRDQPWFCWVSFPGPHEPWDAPEPYASMYDPASMPPPLGPIADAAPRPKGNLDLQVSRRPTLEPGEVEAMRANYAGNVSLLDEQVGRLLDAVESRGELDHTVIVLTSDHGELNGDHGLIKKRNFLDGAVRVPLIVRTPGIVHSAAAGRVSEALVELIDVGPTLVDLAGGAIGFEQFARSLQPVLESPDAQHRAEVVSEFRGEIMMMDHRWKMAVNGDGEPYLLFDRQDDPDERRNLAGSQETREVERDLQVQLFQRLVRTQRDSPWPAAAGQGASSSVVGDAIG